MNVTVTYKNDYGPNYTAASIKTPCTKVDEALEYAYTKTQNVFYNWSERPIKDVTVCHHTFSGTALRSSMVGDEFVVWLSDKEFEKYECDRIGWKRIA